MIQYNSNEIVFNGKKMVFENPIIEADEIDGILIIVFDSADDCENVYGFNNNQDELWRIQKLPYEFGDKIKSPYVGLSIIGGKCNVVDFFGRRFIVDINNGHILYKDFVK